MKKANTNQMRDKMRVMSKQMMDMRDTICKEQKSFETLDTQIRKLTKVIDEEIRNIKNAFSTLADATMEEVDIIKQSVQSECIERIH